MLVHLTHLVLLSVILSYEISCGSFLIQNHVFFVCVCHKSKMNFIPQPQEQKRYRRQIQCSSILCGCFCNWSIWCCPVQPFYLRYYVFLSNQKSCCCFCAFHTSKINFIPQPQDHKSCRRQSQCSSSLCGCLCIQPIWCCPVQPSQMRYFVVHFWLKILFFLCMKQQQNEFNSLTTGTGKL